MSTIALQIGQRMRNYRILAGLSQEKLAELAFCHPTYIGQLERGEKNATLESIERIASALNVPLSKLFEKLESTENEERNIPLKCYELLLSKNIEEQECLLNILLSIDNYKNT